jgi:hypothetical protein
MARTYRKLPEIFPQDIKRFWRMVDKTTGLGPKGDCWHWTGTLVGSRPSNKYGFFKLGNDSYYAHRVSFTIATRTDYADRQVCHRCDNSFCVNPTHLWSGSQEENMQDYFQKGYIRNHPAKGESHHLTNLTNNDIREIRARTTWNRGDVKMVSEQLGIDRHSLLAIRKRRTWKHI